MSISLDDLKSVFIRPPKFVAKKDFTIRVEFTATQHDADCLSELIRLTLANNPSFMTTSVKVYNVD